MAKRIQKTLNINVKKNNIIFGISLDKIIVYFQIIIKNEKKERNK